MAQYLWRKLWVVTILTFYLGAQYLIFGFFDTDNSLILILDVIPMFTQIGEQAFHFFAVLSSPIY
jgi:hypothetical protein